METRHWSSCAPLLPKILQCQPALESIQSLSSTGPAGPCPFGSRLLFYPCLILLCSAYSAPSSRHTLFNSNRPCACFEPQHFLLFCLDCSSPSYCWLSLTFQVTTHTSPPQTALFQMGPFDFSPACKLLLWCWQQWFSNFKCTQITWWSC